MQVPEIDCQSLLQRLHNNESIEVVDIREISEYDAWHISGARNLPTYIAINQQNFEPFIQQVQELPKDREFVFVCRIGLTSRMAAGLAAQFGYNTMSLQGGMRGWSNAWTISSIELSDPDTTFYQIRRDGKGCLSYLIGSKGEAAIFDPNLDESVYLQLAEEANLTIRRVFDTHVHADHISRAPGLSKRASADLIMPAKSALRTSNPFIPIQEDETVQIGGVDIRAIATPGHTTESTCYLINNEILLTGDTLFVESIGRPDLEKGDSGAADGAGFLFDSLHQKLLNLPGTTTIFPGHYSGNIPFNADPIMAKLEDLRSNVALLKINEKESFVQSVVSSIPDKPPSHEMIIAINEGKSELDFSTGEPVLDPASGYYITPVDLEAGPNRCAI